MTHYNRSVLQCSLVVGLAKQEGAGKGTREKGTKETTFPFYVGLSLHATDWQREVTVRQLLQINFCQWSKKVDVWPQTSGSHPNNPACVVPAHKESIAHRSFHLDNSLCPKRPTFQTQVNGTGNGMTEPKHGYHSGQSWHFLELFPLLASEAVFLAMSTFNPVGLRSSNGMRMRV